MVTASAKTRQKVRPPKEWIIPANPKYYDIVGAFKVADEIDWKQGAGIKKGDGILAAGFHVLQRLFKLLLRHGHGVQHRIVAQRIQQAAVAGAHGRHAHRAEDLIGAQAGKARRRRLRRHAHDLALAHGQFAGLRVEHIAAREGHALKRCVQRRADALP